MRCIDCNFDLSHARGQCPECGRAFDAADAGTFIGPGHSRIMRALARAPGWPMTVGAACVALLVLHADFSPAGTFGASITAFAAAVLFGAVFVVRALVALFAHHALPRRTSDARPQRVVAIAPLRWLVPIAVIGAASLIAGLRGPRALAFWLDRRVLEPVALGPAMELDAWVSVDAWTGRVTRGIVRLDALVWAFAPDPAGGGAIDPSDGVPLERPGDRQFLQARGWQGGNDIVTRIPRLAVFPIDGTGYSGTCAAWAYAPGAPNEFFVGFTAFIRLEGGWYRSRGWIDSRELELGFGLDPPVGSDPGTDGGQEAAPPTP